MKSESEDVEVEERCADALDSRRHGTSAEDERSCGPCQRPRERHQGCAGQEDSRCAREEDRTRRSPLMVAALSLPVRVVQAKQTAQRLYESLGWSIIPVDCSVTEIVDGRLVHRKPALIPWKRFTTRRADEQEIAEWRRRFPNAGIAVICGAVSNLLVLDADGAAGVAEAKRRGLPKTPMVSTPSGGLHAYFRAVPGQSFRNGAKLGSSKKLDVRSDAGYVVAPYSTRSDGKRYEWLERPDQTPIAEPPGWFLELLRTAAAANPSVHPCRARRHPAACVLCLPSVSDKGAREVGRLGPGLRGCPRGSSSSFSTRLRRVAGAKRTSRSSLL